MRILLTGATGYIGKRMLPVLVGQGHEVVCCVRDKLRFSFPESISDKVTVIELDFLDESSLSVIPKDIDVAYYLIHSMSSSGDFSEKELLSATNFKNQLEKTSVNQVIYLTGIVNDESSSLSKHLKSRKAVEETLASTKYHLTALRAGIIIGSGSASFEIIRDLVEKLPFMITPKWVLTKCQPIGIADVIIILTKSLENEALYDDGFDIGGPDVLTYKDMMLEFAAERKLKRWIYTVPFMTPKLSSYWLYFVTSTSYLLAISLVDSMKVEVVAKDDRINKILGIKPENYRVSLNKAFNKIEQNAIVSSWKDSFVSGRFDFNITEFIDVPSYGCYIDKRNKKYTNKKNTLSKIWAIGGKTGYYYGDWLWKIRGYIDKLNGGVGLRRGRTNVNSINVGDAIDFWRVLYANEKEGRLLLYAEMKLPGDAWLEFKIEGNKVVQTATFRPRGLWGRTYWYLVLPFHGLIFNGMLSAIAK